MSAAETAAKPAAERPALSPWISWPLIVGLGLGIWLWDVGLGRRPEEVPQWGWKLLAIFLPTVLALMLRPIPGGAAVLLALVVTVLIQALTIEEALRGYMEPTVWLVLAAYMISRAMIKTGLARRIALTFVRLLGHNTLGLGYALVASDTVLAAMIPSNAARVGGVILPITKSLAELYRSRPGATAGLLGTFLMLTIYQGDVLACAMFLTGQASNPLAASQAAQLTEHLGENQVVLHYGNWLLYALAPFSVTTSSQVSTPLKSSTPTPARAMVAMSAEPPFSIKPPRKPEAIQAPHTPAKTSITIHSPRPGRPILASSSRANAAASGVRSMPGRLKRYTSHGARRSDTNPGAWDVFIWYGGLVQLGTMLNDAKVTTVFAEAVAGELLGLPLAAVFVLLLLIYFYAHYAFASITVHMLSMFPAFVKVLLALSAPPWLVVPCFAYFTNFCAGLTHYGTTPAPIVFSTGYVSHGVWWRVGFLMSLVNVAVWLTVGMGWWKLLGLW